MGRRRFPVIEHKKSKTVWMHCASLGEFEQGRPLLENIRKTYPDTTIVLTFFSPSGYEVQHNYPGADYVFYLPMDGRRNTKQWLDILQPSLVLWVKYEFWYYHLAALKNTDVPVLMVSGIFRPGQPFFKWYGGVWRRMLYSFTHFFVQNEESRLLLQSLGHTNSTVGGDTRFDRVIEIAENARPLPLIEKFCKGREVIIAGSTWEDDEAEWTHYVRSHRDICFIFAPHEVDAANIADVKKEFPGSILYSELEKNNSPEEMSAHVLIIDNIGMLSQLYRYATITYVGGGFDAGGIHNILEAVVYGKPVIFGPNYEKFAEAVDLVDTGVAFSIDSAVELEQLLTQLWGDEQRLQEIGYKAKNYVMAKAGATRQVMAYIQANRLLTN